MVFVNTLFGCLATISETHSFIPLWKPGIPSKRGGTPVVDWELSMLLNHLLAASALQVIVGSEYRHIVGELHKAAKTGSEVDGRQYPLAGGGNVEEVTKAPGHWSQETPS